MNSNLIRIEPPQSFKEFLRSTHTGLLKSPPDMVDLGVQLDFERWLKEMNREALFDWVEAYREDQAFRMWEKIEEVAKNFVTEL